jgi:hypothetical protein
MPLLPGKIYKFNSDKKYDRKPDIENASDV